VHRQADVHRAIRRMSAWQRAAVRCSCVGVSPHKHRDLEHVIKASLSLRESQVTRLRLWLRRMRPSNHAGPIHSCKYRWLRAPATSFIWTTRSPVSSDLVLSLAALSTPARVDSLEPVARQPVDPAWGQVHVHEQLHGWRSGTSTSSARQAA
jgi:hypothetical protein